MIRVQNKGESIVFICAPVVQGIEHQPSKLGVAGSSPAGRAYF